VLFTEPIFLFFFLPAVLALYYLAPSRFHNLLLLIASLGFFGWGERKMFFLLPLCILINWGLALWIERTRSTPSGRRVVTLAISTNLLILITFKYATFIVENLNGFLHFTGLSSLTGKQFIVPHITLPLGISFFTFQLMSYIIDVYRGETRASRSLVAIGTWTSFFPQLIAGPIVRYNDLKEQISGRKTTREDFVYGIERFVIGLGKKMIVANTAAAPADQIFSLPPGELSLGLAWLGIICYAVQIYFDFSGYSDMAVGLGRMFGFKFLENFNYPYIAKSITEFWRRWHISLSTWYRDYLYIPLGGNRVSSARVYLNLLIVFTLCGLWHGASWAFLVWGLFHGAFLVIERIGLGKLLDKLWSPLRHAYTLLAVLIGWVFFRAETLSGAIEYLKAMFGLSAASTDLHPVALYVDQRLAIVLLAAVIGSTPLIPWIKRESQAYHLATRPIAATLASLALGLVFLLSVMLVAAGTYNPFIYFRF
jgi:alginate O-acetyltransferase complex protein AlgI